VADTATAGLSAAAKRAAAVAKIMGTSSKRTTRASKR
jgi:hypothetical protein